MYVVPDVQHITPGYRRLSMNELGFIFGFERSLHDKLNQNIFSHIVPLQILDAILRPNLIKSFKSPDNTMLVLPSYESDKIGTWLPLIKQWMPHV